jgi:uncharacterized membrane protein YdjX (TVP38/TMEM64 family)
LAIRSEVIAVPVFYQRKNMSKIKNLIKQHKTVLTVVAVTILIIGISAILLPTILALKEPENQLRFSEFVSELGVWGPLLLLIIQILQVFIAFIPGEPIEIIAGLMYGAWGGLVLCLAGILISTVTIYYTVRKIGRKKLSAIYKKEENLKYSFLFKAENVTYLVFVLFLIPGTPKDILTYLCPFTKIKPSHYFIISTFARIPSILSSTAVGDTLAEGSLWTSAIIFAATGALGLLGITAHRAFMKRHNRAK